MESIFIAEATIQKQKKLKGISYDITPILSSSAGYREKRSHNRICSHWVWKRIAVKCI